MQGFIPLPKSSHKKRIISNTQVYDFELRKEEVEHLDSLDEGQFAFFRLPDSVDHNNAALVTDWDPTDCP